MIREIITVTLHLILPTDSYIAIPSKTYQWDDESIDKNDRCQKRPLFKIRDV